MALSRISGLSDLQLFEGVLIRHEDALGEIYHRYARGYSCRQDVPGQFRVQ